MLSRAARAICRASRSASGLKSFASAFRCTARTKWRHSSVYGSCPRTGTFSGPRSVVRTDRVLGIGPPAELGHVVEGAGIALNSEGGRERKARRHHRGSLDEGAPTTILHRDHRMLRDPG